MVKGQTFEFSVRPCIDVNGTKYTGDWSDVTYRFVNSTAVSTTLSIKNMALTATWDKVVSTGKTISYEVVLTNNGVSKTYKTSNTTMVFKPVVSGHTYSVKVRPIATVGGKNYVGAYSNVANRFVAGTSISKIISPSSKTVTLTVQKFSTATGYDFVYSTSSTFATNKHLMVKGASTITTMFTGLTKGATYYFKVRPYKIIDGVTYYGAYSTIKSIIVK